MIKSVRGTKDIFADEAYLWNEIETTIKNIFFGFNFFEIRTPVFEHTELFLRSVGENSDIVQKEMYTFQDKSGRSLTLKPESTAAVVRAGIEHNLFDTHQKLFYISPAFRYERPQNGRYREFYQCGAEFFGCENSECDAEIIFLADKILYDLGLKNINLKINSIGCKNCRQKYNSELKNFVRVNLQDFCLDCQKRFESNPLRILDCKKESCKNFLSHAPNILDFLCDDCKNHFERLKNLLDKLKINFEVDNKIVRGLDYYTRSVFEFIYNDIAICGGGRYDDLVFELGGKKISAVGFGFGMERLISVIKEQNLFCDCKNKLDLFIGNMDFESREKAFLLMNYLRAENFKIEYNNQERGIKSQLKNALRLNAKFFMIIGDEELKNNMVRIKNLESKKEYEVELNEAEIKKFLLEQKGLEEKSL